MYWFYKKDPENNLCDAPGVRVGHLILGDSGRGIYTGITTILPPGDNPYRDEFIAAVHRVNGFGKPLGLDQVWELEETEFPILLINTLSIGGTCRGLLDYMVDLDQGIDRLTTVNPLVLERSDGNIDDIRLMASEPGHALETVRSAGEDFDQGSLRARVDMVCYGLKGGVGFASRVLEVQRKTYTLGALVLANFGSTRDFRILGQELGPDLVQEETEDQGSIVAVLTTDLPLDSRQLLRLCKRVQSDIARTGSPNGHGSGEFALAFSICPDLSIQDPDLNPTFWAIVGVVEESTLKSLYLNQSKRAYPGKVSQSLEDRVRDHGVTLSDLAAG